MQYPQTRYQDSLDAGITDSALSLTVDTTPPTRTQGILTIGRLTSNTEDVYYTNVVGQVVTINLRGLSQTALTLTEVAGNKKVHAAGESLEITTHHNYDTNKARKDEDETISGNWVFSSKPHITGVQDSNGAGAIDVDATASAVNYLRVINAIAGGNVVLTTVGTDADIDLELQAKGTGVVILEDGAQMKTSAAPTTAAQIANKAYVDGLIAATVKVSSDDTTAGYLNGKLLAGTSISLTEGSPAGNETLTIAFDGVASHLVYTPGYVTGDTGAQSLFEVWNDVTNGSFRATIDGTARNIDAINFTGDASMADVAATIQAAIRAVTAGTETVVWSTDHFVLTSGNTTSSSQFSVLTTSTGTVGTDISGAGAADWLDADTGNGVATAAALNEAGDASKGVKLDSTGRFDETFIPTTLNIDKSYTKLTARETIDGTSTPVAAYVSDGTNGRTAGGVYKADTNDATNDATKFSGFVKESVSSGDTVKLYTGVVNGFTGLTAGVFYYVSDTVGAVATTVGSVRVCVGRAVSTTAINTADKEQFVMIVSKPTFSIPSAGGTATTTVTTYFKATGARFDGNMSVRADAGTPDTSVIIGHVLWTGTTITNSHHYETVDDSATLTAAIFDPGNSTAFQNDTDFTAPTPTSGTNKSTLGLTITSITDSTVVFTLTNTVTAGSGATDTPCEGSVTVWGYTT